VVFTGALARATAGTERAAELTAALARGEEHAARLEGELREAHLRLAGAQAELGAARRSALERAADADRAREQVRAEIEVLAGRLLDEKGKAMLDRSREGLQALLAPLSEKLKQFEAKVDKAYDQENRDRASLLQSLKAMQETQSKLHEDAESLARALTGDAKAQGDWGEMVLERVLETAGLTEGREYDLQMSHVDEEGGRKRPDALVYLPSNRAVVVDAKCSLTAFVESVRASEAEEREAALDRHLASIRAHVKSLAGKGYQEVLKQRTLDIVLMFVPNEAAFHAAIARDAGLYEDAFRQRVVICSPTTLLAALQLVGHVWRSERQNANAQKIADEAGKLLEKLSAFVEDLDGVGQRLDQARASMDAARGKLVSGRGNIIQRASGMVKLGARVRSDRVKLLLDAAGEEAVEDDLEGLAPPARLAAVVPPERAGGDAPAA
jgi:DNA recombination protein RmuC